jgi:hypothetical protein
VSGEVALDTSKVPNDAEATIQKARAIKRAALAPSDPSAQDQRVAAEAEQMEQAARQEIVRENLQALRVYANLGATGASRPAPGRLDVAV